MKIIILGDNHGETEGIENVLQNEEKADLYLHTGDSYCHNSVRMEPFLGVEGNCDYKNEFPEYRIIKTPIGKLFITHGHLLYKYNYRFLKDNDIRICVTGHTHVHTAYKDSDILFINPGSIECPRDGSVGTYVILNITADNVEYVFKNKYLDIVK